QSTREINYARHKKTGVDALKLAMHFRFVAGIVGTAALIGCAEQRPPQTLEQLLEVRAESDARFKSDFQEMNHRLLVRTKAEYDQYTAGQQPHPPVIDLLIIS